MKKHAIIPVFIPHLGCKNDCVFCNQRIITAKTAPVSVVDVKNIIDTHLETLLKRNLETIEIAFYGGSFTGIPMEQQTAFLEVANTYYEKGLVQNIHLSTRPDYINKEILTNLKKYHVGVIELGVQSFDPYVLEKSKRGHTVQDVFDAVALIKEYGFEFGIQLMIGLPGDSKEKCIESAKIAAMLKPDLARLYPTIVFPDTELSNMYHSGDYLPFTEDESVDICKEMYKILDSACVTIMRVGLKSTDLVTSGTDLSSNYHPAFRQLVEGAIARDELIRQLDLLVADFSQAADMNGVCQAAKVLGVGQAADMNGVGQAADVLVVCQAAEVGKIGQAADGKLGAVIQSLPKVTCYAHPTSFSNMIGQNKANKLFILDKYPMFNIRFKVDKNLAPGVYFVE